MAQRTKSTQPTKEQQQIVEQIVEVLREAGDDQSVPRNVKVRLERIVQLFSGDEDISIKVHKAQQELDDINDDTNLQSYTRTQLWNVVSLLEKL